MKVSPPKKKQQQKFIRCPIEKQTFPSCFVKMEFLKNDNKFANIPLSTNL